MEPSDATIEVLKGIRDEVRGVRTELIVVQERVDGLGLEMRETRDQLIRRQTESEMRLATELVGVTSAVLQVRDAVEERVDGLELELRETRDQLIRRQTETELRLATELVSVTSAVVQVRDVLRS